MNFHSCFIGVFKRLKLQKNSEKFPLTVSGKAAILNITKLCKLIFNSYAEEK